MSRPRRVSGAAGRASRIVNPVGLGLLLGCLTVQLTPQRAQASPSPGEAIAATAAVDESLAGGDRAQAAPGGRLPRYLTLELRRDGSAYLDGAAIGLGDLESAARRVLEREQFEGIVIFNESGRQDERWQRASDMVSRLRRSPVRHAARGVPPELVNARVAARTGPRPQGAVASTPQSQAPAQPEPQPLQSAVELLTVGLHVAGPASAEENRKRLVRTFERHFSAFQRCHPLAGAHTQNASFGVDLLVPAQGGQPVVRQTRTRLGGSEFRACMHRAFEAIRFEAPPTARPEIVSYSVLFKVGAD